MKKHLLLAMAVLFVASACNDTTAPTGSVALAPVNSAEGNIPPPPVDAAINVCVSGDGCTTFNGTYFANGSSSSALLAAADLADPSLAFSGTAWLRFAHDQMSGTLATANARVKNTNGNVSGNGTLSYGNGEVVIQINDIITFDPKSDCSTGVPCAEITFTATVNGVSGQQGAMLVFNAAFCVGEENPCFFPSVGGE
jgi:hypothetical protein